MGVPSQTGKKTNIAEFELRQPIANFGKVSSALDGSQVAMYDGVAPEDLEAFMCEVVFHINREPIVNGQFHLGSDAFINGCVLTLDAAEAIPGVLAEKVIALASEKISVMSVGELHHKVYGDFPPEVMMRVCPVEVKKTKTIHNIVLDVAVYINDEYNTFILHRFIGKIEIGKTVKATKSTSDWIERFNNAAHITNSSDVGYLKKKFRRGVSLDGLNFRMIGDTLLIGFHSIQSMFTQNEATIVNVQEIDGKSKKRFLKRNVGISKGSVAVIPEIGETDIVEAMPTFVICEGVATGISLHLALKDGVETDRTSWTILCCGSTSILSSTLLILIDNLTEMRKKGGKRYKSNVAALKKIRVVIAGENDSNMSSKKAITDCLDNITIPDWMDISVVYPLGDYNDFNDMHEAKEYSTYVESMGHIKQLFISEASNE